MPSPLVAEVPAPTELVTRSPSRHSRFYTAMGVVALLIVAVGFGPAVLRPAGRTAPVTLFVAFHGLVFTAWLLLFLTQTLLVARGNVALHRRLGYLAVGLAVLMVVTGYQVAVGLARRGFDLSGDLNINADPHGLLVFQLGDLLSFSVLVTAAILCRRRPEAHKRLMLMATTASLMAAPLSHALSHVPALRGTNSPIILVPLVMLFVAPAIHDRLTRGRIHPVSLWVPIALFLYANLRAALINPSPAWRQFAAWLVG